MISPAGRMRRPTANMPASPDPQRHNNATPRKGPLEALNALAKLGDDGIGAACFFIGQTGLPGDLPNALLR